MLLLFSTSVFITITTNTVVATYAQTSSYPNSNVPLGINLAGIDDWTTQWPFVDAFKISRPWVSQRQNVASGQGGHLNLTPDGWIASLDQGQYAETVMFDDGQAHYPSGKYVLLYDGSGTINFLFGSASVVSQTPGRMLLNIVPQVTGIHL